MKKRLLAIILVLAMCLTLVPAIAPSAQASTNGHTRDEAVAKAISLYQANSSKGYQCPILVASYYKYLGYNTSGDARDYLSNQLPSGWKRYKKSETSPQPGDVVVWGPGVDGADKTYGHVGIVVDTDNKYLYYIDYNGGKAKDNRGYRMRLLNSYSCIIRPDWPGISDEFEIKDGVLVKYKGNGGDVTIPDGVTSIRGEAFYGCTGLTSVTIPNSVTVIFSAAFEGCTSLTSVTIPDSVTEICSNAFEGCTGLSSVTIGNGVTKIGQRAFYRCTGLTSVTIGNRVTEIQSDAFHGCTGLTNIAIPNSVTSIHDSAFGSCTSLTSVTIPDSVTSIDLWAFNYCISLKDVYYSGTQAQWNAIKSDVGDFRSDFASATIHYNSTGPTDQPTTPSISDEFEIKDGALVKYKGNGGDVTIPDGVTSIADGSFHNCTGLTSVTIPDGVTKIGAHAFQNCRNLANITIPNSVTSIGPQSFDGCKSLTDLIIPNSVTSIAYGAFPGCTSLTSLTIPNSVTSIGLAAFYGCTGLTSVIISDSVTSIFSDTFAGCTSLTSVTIPSSVTFINGYAFCGCKSLKNIYYGGSEAQWKAIEIEKAIKIEQDDDPFLFATIHYNSTGPTDQPTTPDQPTTLPTVENIAAAGTAVAQTQNVLLDGKTVQFQYYAVKDANGNMTNYVKLRDLAQALNGTKAQFNVGWDGKISITSDTAYESVGGEGSTPYSGDQPYTAVSNTPVSFNGSDVNLTSFQLKDSAGNGYTYYKLRDLGQLLNFNVTWNGRVVVESDKPYTG